MKKIIIGFIGQGFIGKNYADDFERRRYRTVRYSLETPYRKNKGLLTTCDIIFIAVPTPTTSAGFDGSIVEEAISLVPKGKIAVIKSTVTVGMTRQMQKKYPHVIILHSPEFLSEATAAADAAHPFANIIGMPARSLRYAVAAKKLSAVLPKAPFSLVCTSEQSEIIKYSHNCCAYMEIIFFNLMYDFSQTFGVAWDPIQRAIFADPYISSRYAHPLHKKGRGAGGHCFIKDFATFSAMYEKSLPKDAAGRILLKAAEKKNIELLVSTKKDLDLLRGVYGSIIL